MKNSLGHFFGGKVKIDCIFATPMEALKMTNKKSGSLLDHLLGIPDPRIERRLRRKLEDILAIAVCPIICSADDWVSIEQFGKAKRKWFKTFLVLPNGRPKWSNKSKVTQPAG